MVLVSVAQTTLSAPFLYGDIILLGKGDKMTSYKEGVESVV